MSTNPYRPLAVHCERIGRSRPDLILGLGLPGVATTAELFAVIRCTHRPEVSDEALRRLARRGRLDVDAVTLIVGALMPQLAAWATPGRSSEFCDDLPGDLTLTVYDAIDREDFEGCSHLAARLRWRAHVRVSKRNRRTRVHGERYLSTTDPCGPEMLAVLCAEHGPVPDDDPVADAVIPRVDLGRFGAACQEAVANGSIPAKAWDAFRDHRLRRVLVEPSGPVPDADRKRAERAAVRIRGLVDDLLGGHVA